MRSSLSVSVLVVTVAAAVYLHEWRERVLVPIPIPIPEGGLGIFPRTLERQPHWADPAAAVILIAGLVLAVLVMRRGGVVGRHSH